MAMTRLTSARRPRLPTRIFIDRPSADLVLAGTVFVVLWWLSLKDPWLFKDGFDWRVEWLTHLEVNTRRAVYQTMATLSGTLLGLTLTSVSILSNLMKQDLATATGGLLKPRHQHRVSGLFFAGIRGLGVTLVISFALLISDGSRVEGDRLAQNFALAVVVLAVMRLGRIIWVLSLVMNVSVAAGPPSKPENPPITDDEY